MQEYQYAFELRQLDRGEVRSEDNNVELENDAAWNSDVEVGQWEERDAESGEDTSDEDKPKTKRKSKPASLDSTKTKRKRLDTTTDASKGKRKVKSKLKMDAKTYTMDSLTFNLTHTKPKGSPITLRHIVTWMRLGSMQLRN